MIPDDKDERLAFARNLLHDMGVEADELTDDQVRSLMRRTASISGGAKRGDPLYWHTHPTRFPLVMRSRMLDQQSVSGRAIRDLEDGERVAYGIIPGEHIEGPGRAFGLDLIYKRAALELKGKPILHPDWVSRIDAAKIRSETSLLPFVDPLDLRVA